MPAQKIAVQLGNTMSQTRYTRWVNFYPPTDGNGPTYWATTSWINKALAEAHAKPGRLACVCVTFYEGQGTTENHNASG